MRLGLIRAESRAGRRSMARFYFDAHNSGLEEWDDDGTECKGRDEIEAHAYQVAKCADNAREVNTPPVIVTVLNSSQTIVMTAKYMDKDLKCFWLPPFQF